MTTIEGSAAPSARELVRRLEETFEVELWSIVDDQELSRAEKSRRVRARLVPAVIGRFEQRARPEDLAPELEGFDARAAVDRLTSSRSQVPICPNFFVKQSDVNVLLGKRNDEVFEYVTYLQNRLYQMSTETDPTALAVEMSATGIIGFLVEATRVAVKAYRVGGVTVAQAIASGIRGVSMTAVLGVVAVIMAEVVLWLASSNPKKFIGAIVNDTDYNLVVNNWREDDDASNLYFETGEATGFPEEHVEDSLDSPVVQIRKRMADPEAGDLSIICSMGFFTAEKKWGLFGTEGAMVLSPDDPNASPFVSFVLLFACPYTKANGGNVYLQSGTVGGAKPFYDMLYDGRSLFRANEAGGFSMQVAVNSESGGVAAAIAGIVKL